MEHWTFLFYVYVTVTKDHSNINLLSFSPVPIFLHKPTGLYQNSGNNGTMVSPEALASISLENKTPAYQCPTICSTQGRLATSRSAVKKMNFSFYNFHSLWRCFPKQATQLGQMNSNMHSWLLVTLTHSKFISRPLSSIKNRPAGWFLASRDHLKTEEYLITKTDKWFIKSKTFLSP